MYSLGDFLYQNTTLPRFSQKHDWCKLGRQSGVADVSDGPDDMGRRGFPGAEFNAESVIAAPHFIGRRTRRGPPVSGFRCLRRPITVRGRRMLAGEKLGRTTIGDLTGLSEPSRTKVIYRNRVGVVRPSSQSTTPAQ